ncbi:MAG: DUF2799 domain-containing protein [Paracoccaceae bacterium]
MLFRFFAISLLFALASCASLSEDACRSGNWQAIGYNDGANGRSQNYLNEHREACVEYGIAPDQTAWLRARLEGLKQYCTRPNAYQIGRRGSDLNPVCSSDLAGLKLANFYGLRYYEIRREIDTLEHELDETLRILAMDFNGDLTLEQNQLQKKYFAKTRKLERRIRNLTLDLRKYAEMP